MAILTDLPRSNDVRVGFTCGAFDLVHAGHIHHFTECRALCDYLIVGLHTNPAEDRPHKSTPVQTMYERWSQLAAISGIDQIIPYNTEVDLCNMLATLPITIRFVGSDHQEEYDRGRLTGQFATNARGIDTIVVPRYHTYSSSELRQRVINTK